MGNDTQKSGSSAAAKATDSTPDLTANQVAVRQLVTITPEPRTADELAKRYDGLRTENMWPEQTQRSVKERIEELIDKGLLAEGDAAPEGDPTIVLAD